jgi:hypothetical protein
MLQLKTCCYPLAMLIAQVGTAGAASITLSSMNSGVFQYQLTLAAGETVVFDQNDQITLTGLTGVTATAASNVGFSACGFTATSACFAEIFASEILDNSNPDPSSYNFFTITSTSTSVGPVDYSAQANTPFSGEVDGPAPAPETGSGWLTAAGLIGLLLSAMRSFLQRLVRRILFPL